MSSSFQLIIKDLPACVTGAQVNASDSIWDHHTVKTAIVDISRDIVAMDDKSTLWRKTKVTPHSISVNMLFNRLETGKAAAHPIEAYSFSETSTKALLQLPIAKSLNSRPLEDFQDLYLASIAKIRDIHQHVALRINNGFMNLTDVLSPSGGLTLGEAITLLEDHWDTLNEPGLMKSLDNASREAMRKHGHAEILSRFDSGQLTKIEAEECFDQLYNPALSDMIAGIPWIMDWAPGMIGAFLEEKYRVMLRIEKEECARRKNEEMSRMKNEEMLRKKEESNRKKEEMSRKQKREHLKQEHLKREALRRQANQFNASQLDEQKEQTIMAWVDQVQISDIDARRVRVQNYMAQMRQLAAAKGWAGARWRP